MCRESRETVVVALVLGELMGLFKGGKGVGLLVSDESNNINVGVGMLKEGGEKRGKLMEPRKGGMLPVRGEACKVRRKGEPKSRVSLPKLREGGGASEWNNREAKSGVAKSAEDGADKARRGKGLRVEEAQATLMNWKGGKLPSMGWQGPSCRKVL